jgi:pyruvate kinase
MMRLMEMPMTKVICTLGPSTDAASVMDEMSNAGMSVARLNFSHGDHDEHKRRIEAINLLNNDRQYDVKILQDLEGFRVRIGMFAGSRHHRAEVKAGETVRLTNRATESNPGDIPLDYRGSLRVLSLGDPIHIDDGSISLKAIDVADDSVTCEVIVPGTIREHKGVNIPNARFPFEGLTEKDQRDIDFGIENRVDFIAQSFVRNGQDIADIRDRIRKSNFSCRLIAKIENRDGIRNLDEILEVADGVMIARGDLGVSLPIFEVPVLQKILIRECRRRNKYVITATQMMESMTGSPSPTRAEVSDVANAVLDGSDYVMLSGETAVGSYPVETVKMMSRIIDFAERFPSIGYFTR